MEIKYTKGFMDDLERLFSWKYAPLRACQWVIRLPREIKWLWQRMTRGWADCDVWSMDSYLARVVPEMLEHLKKNHCGIPGFTIGTSLEESEVKWVGILDEMVAGFKAHDELHDLEVGDDFEAYRKKQDEIEAKRIKGMNLFVEHFHSLWD